MQKPTDQTNPYELLADAKSGEAEVAAPSPQATRPRPKYADADADGDRYLSGRQVRQRYGGCSDMWLWRRAHDDSGFPKPLEICGRRFWKMTDLTAWEKEQWSKAALSRGPRE
jgi:hypothetical protein